MIAVGGESALGSGDGNVHDANMIPCELPTEPVKYLLPTLL